jgi:Predicted membrane protein
VGSLAAITLIALFPQDRWLFLIGMSIFTGFCTYMMPGTSRWYFWYVAGFSVPLIALAGGADPLNDFQTVITRSEETALGIVSYSLVWLLIWPTSSREALEDAVRRLAAAHRQLAAHYLTPTIGETHDAGPEALRRQTTQVLARLGGLLDGAEIDSYEVWEARHAWRSLIHQLSQLTSTSERWRQSSADVREVDRQRLIPELAEFAASSTAGSPKSAHAGGASAGARADFCAAEPRRQGDGFAFAVPPGRAPPLSQSPAGNRQAHARSL